MRLTDITLDVQSEAAFGLLGTAARAAIPYLQKALADNAVVDLKPFAASALKSIELDRRLPEAGRRRRGRSLGHGRFGSPASSSIRQTLRVTGEADGTARALVRKIALQ